MAILLEKKGRLLHFMHYLGKTSNVYPAKSARGTVLRLRRKGEGVLHFAD